MQSLHRQIKMSDNPVLSIITVCYNEKEVERTCKSITEQTFKDFEWIVIDGGSNAETLKILEKYKFKMDFFVSEKDTGIYNAMNKGIAQAKGIWLNFMNAGDAFFENTSLEKLFFKNANSFKKNDVVYCNSLSHKDNGKTYTTNFYKKLDYPFWCENCISHQASFIKKELFEKFGPYSEEYKISGDLDKWLLFLLGAFGLYGFMFLYLAGLSKTTPVSSSIFTSLQPIWVFLIMIFFYKEKATWKKILGISIGLVGALVCILTQQSDDLASDAFVGNMLCLISSIVYAVYLILSQRILSSIGAMTMLRYTFSGAAVSAIIVTFITGFDAPVFSMPFHWTPFLILMFVLIFPTTISYMLLPVGLKYLKTTVVAIYGYLILIVATIASLALGQDRFSWTQTCAIIFICIGVYLVEVAESKDKSPDPLKK